MRSSTLPAAASLAASGVALSSASRTSVPLAGTTSISPRTYPATASASAPRAGPLALGGSTSGDLPHRHGSFNLGLFGPQVLMNQRMSFSSELKM
jgi:hypothetical protein